MMAKLETRRIPVIWALILLLGLAAGEWGGRRAGARAREALATEAKAFAVAVAPDQPQGGGEGDPSYSAARAQLARLQQTDARVRWVFLLRPSSAAMKAGSPALGAARFVFLAGSAPGALQPGADYGDAAGAAALQQTFRTGIAGADGPIRTRTGTLFVGYAPAGDPAGDILGVEAVVGDWNARWWGGALPYAVYAWLLLGLPFAGILVARDLERQRLAMRNLSEAMEQSRSAVVIVNLEGRIVYANAGFCQQTGRCRRALIGSPVRALQQADADPAVSAEMVATVQAGQPWQGEWTSRRGDGGPCTVRGVVTPVKNRDGSTACFVAVFEDVTAAKKDEEALRATLKRAEAGDRTKNLFLATMSHEVRTPLNGIVGFTSLLMETSLTAEQREYVETIRASGGTLIQLAGDILDFARMESGSLKLEPRQANPRAAVEDTLDLFAVPAAKGLELLHWIDDAVPAVVVCDDARLRQVLGNLVSNAVKFTDKGFVEVTLQAGGGGGEDPDRCRLTFTVRDTGIGIAPEHHDNLFKPFIQLDGSVARPGGGSGLGLAISSDLVRLMGGEIRLDSAPGRGSAFSFTIPVRAVPGMARAAPAPGPLRIALVAAPGPFRDEFARLARRWGAPMTAVDAPEGLAGVPRDMTFVELNPEQARRLAAEPAGAPPWPPAKTCAIVPYCLDNSLRPALRTHFCRLISKPLHHDALAGLLAGIKPPEVPARAPSKALGLNVLIVEDNPVNQRLVQKLLGNLGCRATVAANGRIGLDELGRPGALFDVVLMDLHMPELDGLGAIERMRRGEAGAAAASVWVTVLTADARPEQRERGFAIGANDYLVKPVSLGELAASLHRYLESRSLKSGDCASPEAA